jgi:mono/diheme cytochrome c family protein
VKSTFFSCVLTSLLLSGCAKQATVSPSPTPNAYGAQIVEQSGGKQTAGVGAKLNDPVVVQVNGANGNAVTGALVTFHGYGVIVVPSQALSDENGQVSTAVQLGTIPGDYLIIAETPKSGGGIFSVNLREIALGYQEKVGKQISDKYCVMCHDPESTPERVSNFENLAPPQPHLFSDGSALNAMSDADLVKIIADGGPALGKSPQTPAYRSTLTPGEIKAVVAYIRAIADPPYSHSLAAK